MRAYKATAVYCIPLCIVMFRTSRCRVENQIVENQIVLLSGVVPNVVEY